MSGRDKNIVGEVLAKTYRIERFLGSGSVGTVYVARHVRSGGLYAVKVLHRRLSTSAEVYQRFQDEARLVATLRHPHILPITDFDRDDNGVPFFVMDLLEGESLAQRLKHKETLSFAQTMDLVSQTGSALHAAHRSGIVHRNLRPENVFLVRHDLGDRVVETVKVTDFGLSCFRRMLGTGRDFPPTVYHAPELFQEGAAMDGRVDQWALAALAYRLLSGKSPFEEGTAEEIIGRLTTEAPRPLGKWLPELPPNVVAAIHRGMARRREDRYETTLDFVRAVSPKNASGSALEAVPEHLVARASPPSGRVIAPPPTPAVETKPVEPQPTLPPPSAPPRAVSRPRLTPAQIPALAAPPPLFEKTPPPMQVPREKSQLPTLLFGGGLVVVLLVLIVVVAVRKPAQVVQVVPTPPVVVPVPPPVATAFLPDLAVADIPRVSEASAPPTAPTAPVFRDVGLSLRGPDANADGTASAAPVKTTPAQLPAASNPVVANPVASNPIAAKPNTAGTTPAATPGNPPAGTPVKAATPGTPVKPATPTGATADPAQAAGTVPSQPPTPNGTGDTGVTGPASPKPAGPPEKTPAELLAEAKDLYKTGEKERALHMALQIAEKPGPHVIDAWRWVGSAACSIHDASIASRAYAHLASNEHKQLLVELCQRSGLVLQGSEFINVE